MDGRILREIGRNQQNGSTKSNRKDMPHNATTPNLFDRNRTYTITLPITKSGTHLNINTDNIADLLNLRERSQTNLKSPRAEAKEIPSKGDIVQMKANIPRGS